MSEGHEKNDYSLTEATGTGDELLMMKTLRYYLAQQIERAEDGRELAALSRQFADVTQRVNALEKAKPKPDRRTALDEARNKRKKAPIKRKPGTAH